MGCTTCEHCSLVRLSPDTEPIPSTTTTDTKTTSTSSIKGAGVLSRLAGAERHFVLRAVLGGLTATCLIDTGATITLISPERAKAMACKGGAKIEDCEKIHVTIANGMCEVITKKIDSTICINGITTPITLYLMSLPRQYDMLLGMDWLQSNDVWLNPRRKLLSLVNGDGTRDAKICLCTASHLSCRVACHALHHISSYHVV